MSEECPIDPQARLENYFDLNYFDFEGMNLSHGWQSRSR
jgi:hypothetical protein